MLRILVVVFLFTVFGAQSSFAACFGAPNSLLDAGEVCDDGNAVDGDGCSAQCELEDYFICAKGFSVFGDGPCVTAGPDSVVPHQPFVCAENTVWNISNRRLSEFNFETEETRLIGITLATLAFGFRKEDGFIYSASGTNLVRIGANGRVRTVGDMGVPISGTPGEFGPDGRYYVYQGQNYHAVNVETLEVETQVIVGLPACTDLTLNVIDNHFYCVNYIGDNKLYRIEPATGASVAIGEDIGLGRFPAMFSSNEGVLYGRDVNGDYYRFSIEDGSAHLVASGDPGNGDGTSCNGTILFCNADTDCEPPTECVEPATCENGDCVYAPKANGTVCTDGFCNDGVCGPCGDEGPGVDPGCTAETPACTAIGTCGECTEVADCAGADVCDVPTNSCQPCTDDSDDGVDSGCTEEAPVCDDDFECVPCQPTDSDVDDGCTAEAPKCDQTEGVCRACLDDAECEGGVCEAGACVACRADDDCATGVCSQNECVECAVSSDCADGMFCFENVCVSSCRIDEHCSESAPVCVEEMCVVCSDSNTSACVDSTVGFACVEGACGCTSDNDCARGYSCGDDQLCTPILIVAGGQSGCSTHAAHRLGWFSLFAIAAAMLRRSRRQPA